MSTLNTSPRCLKSSNQHLSAGFKLNKWGGGFALIPNVPWPQNRCNYTKLHSHGQRLIVGSIFLFFGFFFTIHFFFLGAPM